MCAICSELPAFPGNDLVITPKLAENIVEACCMLHSSIRQQVMRYQSEDCLKIHKLEEVQEEE
jgi:hypothetical protein